MNQANAAQLAECIGVTKRTIQKRASKEAWPFKEYPVRGGMQRMYIVDLLPEDIAIRVQRCHAAQQGCSKPDNVEDDAQYKTKVVKELGAIEFLRAKSKYALLQAALRFARSSQKGKVEALEEFVQRFELRKVPVEDFVYREVPQVSRVSLLRWEKRYEESGLLGLLDGFNAKVRRFESDITEQLQQRFTELLAVSPQCGVSHAFSYFSAIFPVSFLPSARRWESLRESILKELPRASTQENLDERPIWEMFVFPVALRFSDVENVAVMITELQSGRHFFALVETVTEQVCDALLRRALMHWDLPEGVKIVSGLLPVSYTLQSILRALGVRCWSNNRRYPMSGRSVELVRYLLFCLCRSVQPDDVNSLMARVMFDLVQMTDVNRHQMQVIDSSESSLSGTINMPMLDLPYSADELHHRIAAQRSSQDKIPETPFVKECFIEPQQHSKHQLLSERLLDGLLAALPQDSGFAEVSGNGLMFEGKCYTADWLVDYVGHVVHCRWDPVMTQQLFVFTGLTKQFLGIVQSSQ